MKILKNESEGYGLLILLYLLSLTVFLSPLLVGVTLLLWNAYKKKDWNTDDERRVLIKNLVAYSFVTIICVIFVLAVLYDMLLPSYLLEENIASATSMELSVGVFLKVFPFFGLVLVFIFIYYSRDLYLKSEFHRYVRDAYGIEEITNETYEVSLDNANKEQG
ncbi:MAG: Unknown protein [uncultured Sulfurovum sp.]|uniref:Uncharacterized protein n=1 Tax=uncultured Sulfurovum sp. TaxID=269237 RepID=A0A6S6SRA7_9BACT|nr:MAG: Unknown protein [uncultured Sulfurovum sp.]